MDCSKSLTYIKTLFGWWFCGLLFVIAVFHTGQAPVKNFLGLEPKILDDAASGNLEKIFQMPQNQNATPPSAALFAIQPSDKALQLSELIKQLQHTISSRIKRAKQFRDRLHAEFTANRRYLNNSTELGRFITYRPPQGGLGNFMFIFATFVGCASKNQRIPVLFTREQKMSYFEGMDLDFVNETILFPNNSIDSSTLGENGPAKFTAKFHDLNALFPNQPVALTGYGQSWKYFHDISDEIRAMYTFKEPIQLEAIYEIAHGIANLYDLNLFTNGSMPIRAGIHVRRGDIVLNDSQKRHGHVPASEEYLLRTALHIQRKYKHVAFFVLSNDIEYCRRLFREGNFVFVSGKSPEVDMAIMTFMDVMVVSVGSYGWWGAYLSDAKEIFYFRDWPRNGSDFQKGLIHEDYFLPHWLGRD